ncbi:MAG TPA: hypothetical protein VMV45_15460 [Casimicrobiaceae bacterium]|nr:hypothetical protein [Casimicrobiaceae bacterium]
MARQSFPASDAPQLEGITFDGEPVLSPGEDPCVFTAPVDEAEVDPRHSWVASERVLEETLTVSDQGAITLRHLGEPQRLQIYLGEEGLALSADDLDLLIATLERKRAEMRR